MARDRRDADKSSGACEPMVDSLVIVFSELLGSIIIPLPSRFIRLQSHETVGRMSRVSMLITRANRSGRNAL
ncbi:hypothetical protein N9Y61_03440 [Paracoccaceae bacterium]|nr:hypothetical protein [Paracoccaceae bacterium]